MKKLLFILLVFSVLKLNAADIYVNNSGQAGTYTAIQIAINAAAAGDRIFVSPYGLYTENLTIAKSLTITSAVANTRFSVVGTVTVTSAPNQDVIIIGGEFSGSLTGNTGAATLTNKGTFTVSDCKFPGITNGDYILSKLLFCEITNSAQIKHGLVIGSILSSLTIPDGPNSLIGDTIKIIGNILNYLEWNNNDCYYFISNDYITNSNGCALRIKNNSFNSSINNIVSNNTIFGSVGGGSGASFASIEILVPTNTNLNNINFINNLINNNAGTSTIGCGSSPCSTVIGNIKHYYNSFSQSVTYVQSSGYGQLIVGNTIYPSGGPQWTSVNGFGKPTVSILENVGSPALQYYDIDLTRNDIGTFGGPYSIDNYWNTATGRARIYDLNMPFEIWNGSTPSIKAEGIHIK